MPFKENRKEERVTYETSETAFVEFKLIKNFQTFKHYDLQVKDRSKYGIGILVTQKNFDLLQFIKEGDKLESMVFFSTRTLVRVNGIVRHKTKLEQGEYKDCYIIGIKSENIMEYCKSEIY